MAAGDERLSAADHECRHTRRARSENRHALRAAALFDCAGAVGRGADTCRRGAARHQRADVGADLLAAHSRSQRRGRAARVAQSRAAGRRQPRLAARRAATMSPRRRKARGRTGELPLHSPHWMPATEAHRMLPGLRDDPDLAAKDLTAAVADKRSAKRLPCMQRAIARDVAPDQDRKIVPLSFWKEYDFGFDPVSEKLQIWPKGLAVEFRFKVAFFVWKSKFEKIWPALAASAAPHTASSARDDEPTPAPTARTDDKAQRRRPGPKIKQNWRLFVAVKVHEIREKEGRTPSAGELAQICEVKNGYQPDESDIQKFLRILLND